MGTTLCVPGVHLKCDACYRGNFILIENFQISGINFEGRFDSSYITKL